MRCDMGTVDYSLARRRLERMCRDDELRGLRYWPVVDAFWLPACYLDDSCDTGDACVACPRAVVYEDGAGDHIPPGPS